MYMKIELPIFTFASFKVFTSLLFFLSFVFFRNVTFALVTVAPLLVGKAHALGAWVAMWRAGKLNVEYVLYVTLFIVYFTYLGLFQLTFLELSLLATILFIIHFVYDEYDLQEEKRINQTVVLVVPTAVLIIMYYLEGLGLASITSSFFYIFFMLSSLLEIYFYRKINWFYLNLKVIQVFLLFFFYFNLDTKLYLNTILSWHYLFWFVFPVYKLHKHNREDRDNLIILLLILILTSIFYMLNIGLLNEEMQDFFGRYFSIVTIVHILSTAPFGYFFGLPKPKYYT